MQSPHDLVGLLGLIGTQTARAGLVPPSTAPQPQARARTALMKRTDRVGVRYTRGVRAKLEHASAVGEKELGWSGPQFAVGARRQWGIS